METQVKISVIVPVYNTVNYLDRCVKSILCQSFSDFELLLIDDGSSDGSASLCDKLVTVDNRIRVFHQSNAGVSVARNLGLKEMRGEYLAFVDADDYVSPDYLSDLYESLDLSKGNGLIIQSLVQVALAGQILEVKSPGDAFVACQDFGSAICQYQLYKYGYIASKLYDAKLVQKHNLCFDERIKVLEDLFFMYQYMLLCDYIVLSNKSNYTYVKYPFSGCRTIHPFDSVYAGFCFYQELIAKLMNKYGFPSKEEQCGLYQSVMLGFDWSLKTDYWHLTEISCKTRISHLSLLVNNNYQIMYKYYKPVYKLDIIGKYLLKKRLFRLYDSYIVILIKMNITSFLHAPRSQKMSV